MTTNCILCDVEYGKVDSYVRRGVAMPPLSQVHSLATENLLAGSI